ncbi:MAG: RnfH family protein [Pseudomonadales bacterium]|nr:RnfH family protein [Pseudomonadales bacterium]
MSEQSLTVEVVYALLSRQHSLYLNLPVGATVQHALDLASGSPPFSELDLSAHTVGIYSEIVNDLQRVLGDGDRVEIYRPLQVDPMQQRHARALSQSGKK